MKKPIIIILIAAAIALLYPTVISYVSKVKENTLQRNVVRPILSDKLPEGFDSAYVAKMTALGMSATKEAQLLLYTQERQNWKAKYGLIFMGDTEMSEFLKENNFLLADANRYKFMIPVESGKKMIAIINEIKDSDKDVYILNLHHTNQVYELRTNELKMIPLNGTTIKWNELMDEGKGLKDVITAQAIQSHQIKITSFFFVHKKAETVYPIQIIGDVKDFNTEGMVIENNILSAPPPKDPIAVLKVPNGYVELANWE